MKLLKVNSSYRQNSSLPEASMTTLILVIQTDKIHESTLAVRLTARNTDSPIPRQPTLLHHSTAFRVCFAVNLSKARPIESYCSRC